MSDHPDVLPQMLTVQADSVSLSWSAIPGRHYRVEAKSNMPGANWQPLADEVQALGPIAQKTDILPHGRTQFYRVIQLE